MLDAGHRRVALITALVGAFAGVPSLVASYHTRTSTSADWLLRSDKFMAIGRFSELNIPLPVLIMIAVIAVIVWIYRRDLILPWSLAVAGLVLMNQQIITGLQIENFHWSYVCGPCLSLLIGLISAGWFTNVRAKHVRRCLVVVSGLCLVTGFWLRWVEAVRTKEVVEILGIYRDYREQRLSTGASFRLAEGAVIAADEMTADWAAILERSRPLANYWVMLSPSVDNDEWDMRIALNSYLLGLDQPAFRSEQEAVLSRPGFQGPWGRDRVEFERRIESRMTWYNKIASRLETYLIRSSMRYVWLPQGHMPPGDRTIWTDCTDRAVLGDLGVSHVC